MGKITVNAPVETVFEAVSDLTRHAGWAAHDIVVTAETEWPVEVGHIYSSGKIGNKLDRISVTEYVPNNRFGFHVVMPNGWELDWLISVSADGQGAKVDRKGRIAKMPWYQTPFLLIVATIGPIFERRLAKKMKADIEGGG